MSPLIYVALALLCVAGVLPGFGLIARPALPALTRIAEAIALVSLIATALAITGGA